MLEISNSQNLVFHGRALHYALFLHTFCVDILYFAPDTTFRLMPGAKHRNLTCCCEGELGLLQGLWDLQTLTLLMIIIYYFANDHHDMSGFIFIRENVYNCMLISN